MNCNELKQSIEKAPVSSRATLEKLYLYVTIQDQILPEFAEYLDQAHSYQDFFNAIYNDENRKFTLLWAECARLNRRNWLQFFEPKMLVQNLRMKTDGLPIQFGSGVVMAPTGGRDNIANLYVFPSEGFNTKAADYVTSIGGKFVCADYEFHGIYGLYKYRGSVILEEWQVEADPKPVNGDTWKPE